MRKALGVLVLVLGVAALGWYGAKHNAKRIERTVTDGASGAVAGSVHGVKTVVSGRDIEVSGVADSAEERDGILGILDTVVGRRVVRDKMTVLASASPYVFSATKLAKGTSVSGNVPTEEARQGIAVVLNHDASALKLASGAPDAWTIMAQDGLSALSKLVEGTLTLSDKTVTLSGVAKTPADVEAVLAQLKDVPEGYTIKSSIDTLDDGKPLRLDLTYSASDGASVDGKLPEGLTLAKIAAALGLGSVSGDPATATSGEPGGVLASLQKFAGWLPEFETLTVETEGGGFGKSFAVDGQASPGADLELLKSQLADSLGDKVAVTVEAASALPPEGTSRVNAATGENEVMTAGYWLPQMNFTAGYGQCRDQANALLDKRDVNFVTGSARLSAQSLRVINAITALVMKCVQSGGLHVDVGGHTDSQGDSAFNKELSQKRADAVVKALRERGIPEAAITATGYGDTQPVAGNDTEEGRAANRRVTLAFTQ